jgi:hypothetical protein
MREQAALIAEIAGLRATEGGLEAQQRRLQQSRVAAEAERAVLSALAAQREAKNNGVRAEIAAQSDANHALQSSVDRAIGHLGTLQGNIGGERKDIGTLIAFITPRVMRLEAAAEDPAQSPSLAGLLAVAAYRVSPYNPDDPANPGVYNALWIAFSRLNQAAALALIAPVPRASTKIGTTTSSVLVTDICALETGGFTAAERKQFFPMAAKDTPLSEPCRGA